jgi:hypothetical protein
MRFAATSVIATREEILEEGLERQLLVFPGTSRTADMESTISSVEDAFEKIQSLAGVWDGRDDRGMPARTTFERIAENTAVMETLAVSGTKKTVTLYSVHGGAISLIRYCAANNQPQMLAVPRSGAIEELLFEFKDARNLFSQTAGRAQSLALRFEDANHIVETWTWRSDGRDTLTTFNFKRSQFANGENETSMECGGLAVGPYIKMRSPIPVEVAKTFNHREH